VLSTPGLQSGKNDNPLRHGLELIPIHSWNLGAAVLVSIGGRLSDIFGRRYFYMAAPVISAIGAVVGATSHSIGQSIASGVIFGIGGGLGEMSLGLVQEIVPNRWRITILGRNFTCMFVHKIELTLVS
jgi:MFS family permease